MEDYYEYILITGEINEFLDQATVKQVEEFKDFAKEYYKNDICSRRSVLRKVENYFYRREYDGD